MRGNSLISIACRGEPNPIGSGFQLQSDRPFYQSSEEAIILFHIRVALGDPMAYQQQHGGDFVLGYIYKLFVHRKSLLTIYDQHCADVEKSISRVEDENTGLDTIVIDDYDWSSYINTWESEESENEDNTVIRARNKDPIPIPWSSWGPPVTRWFPADNATRWITTTAGQRSVLLNSTRRQYVVLDFNPENLRRAENELGSPPLNINHRIYCYRNSEALRTEGVFKDSVVSKLPFVVYVSDRMDDSWDGALMDEERILGVQVCNWFFRFHSTFVIEHFFAAIGA